MAQIKKFNLGGSNPESTPKKIKIKLDNQEIELSEQELDDAYAEAFRSINATGAIGSGDEQNWNKRYLTFKDRAKNGLYDFDTNQDQTLGVNYSGTTTNEQDQGLKNGKTRRVTALGKLFGGVDSDHRQTSMIHYYMGPQIRNILQQKDAANKKASDELLQKNKQDAKSWAEKFNNNFSLGYSGFGEDFLTNPDAVYDQYWNNPTYKDDNYRINFFKEGVGKQLQPLFALDPTKDALKVEALKELGYDVEKLKRSFEPFFKDGVANLNATSLQELLPYANAQNSIAVDRYFWDRKAWEDSKKPPAPPANSDGTPSDDDLLRAMTEGTNSGTTPGTTPDLNTDPTQPQSYIGGSNYFQANSFFDLQNGITPEEFKNSIGDDAAKINLWDSYLEDLNNKYSAETGSWQPIQMNQNSWKNSNLKDIFYDIPENEKGYRTVSFRIIPLANDEVLILRTSPKNSNGLWQQNYNLSPEILGKIVSGEGKLLSNLGKINYDRKRNKYVFSDGEIERVFDDTPMTDDMLKSVLRRLDPNAYTSYLHTLLQGNNGQIISKKSGGILFAQSGQKILYKDDIEPAMNKLMEKYGMTQEAQHESIQRLVDNGKIQYVNANKPQSEYISQVTPNINEPRPTLTYVGAPTTLGSIDDISDLTTTDWLDIGAFMGDLGATTASFIPGQGIAGGALGLGSAGASLQADIKRDGFQMSDLGWFGLDAGTSLLSMLPGGGVTKIPRLLSKVSKLKPALGILQMGLTGLGLVNSARVIEKIVRGDFEKLSIQDMRDLTSGINAYRQARKLRHTASAFEDKTLKKGESIIRAEFDINGKRQKQTLILSPEETKRIKEADDPELIAKQIIKHRINNDAEFNKRLNQQVVEDDDINLLEQSNGRKWYGVSRDQDVEFLRDREGSRYTQLKSVNSKNSKSIASSLLEKIGIKPGANITSHGGKEARLAELRNQASVQRNVPITDKRKRVLLDDEGKFVDVEDTGIAPNVKNKQELKNYNQKAEASKKVIKQYNDVPQIQKKIDEELAKLQNATPEQKEAILKNVRTEIDKLEKIQKDFRSSKVNALAKDEQMKRDMVRARANLTMIVRDNNVKFHIASKSKALNPSARRDQALQKQNKQAQGTSGVDVINLNGTQRPEPVKGSIFVMDPSIPLPVVDKGTAYKQGLNQPIVQMSKTRPNKESLLKSLKNGILSRAFLPQEIPNVAKAVNARAPKVINKKTPGPMYKRKPSGKKTNNKRQDLPRTTKKALGGKILMFQNEGVILKRSFKLPFENPIEKLDWKPWIPDYLNDGSKNYSAIQSPTWKPTQEPEKSQGVQSGITPKLPSLNIDPQNTLKLASVINKIRSLRNQDTRYAPTIQTSMLLPTSSISGTAQIEDQYDQMQNIGRREANVAQTSDPMLNAQRALSTEQNIRNFQIDGRSKMLTQRDALNQRNVAERAAQAQQDTQVANANQAEFQKKVNAETTNKNFIMRNIADLESGYMDDQANRLLTKTNQKEQIEDQLALTDINTHFENLLRPEMEQLTMLENKMQSGQPLSDEDREKYNKLLKLRADIKTAATKVSYQYMIDRKMPNLLTYSRETFGLK